MKSPFVADLQPNQQITATFLVLHKDVRQKKTGEPFLSLVLGDRSGDVEAKMWDNVAEVVETFEKDHFIKVRGVAQVYQNKLQFTIHKLMKIADSDVDAGDYFPASERDPAEMFAELQGIIAGFSNPHLKGLLNAFFDDPEIARRYRTAPAAKTIHHAWLGGLIEHVLSLCTLCRLIAPHYKDVDIDLMLTGAILHDIGKIYELNYERGFSYSNDGQLLGHIVIGLRMVDDKIRGLADFPPQLRTLVEHLVISHHGELAFGSPKVPVFAEAMLLHHLDNMDSKMECVRGLIAKDKQVDGFWTGYSSALERSVLKKARYLEGPSAPPPVAPDPPVNGEFRLESPRQAPPRPPQPPPSSSPFASKLQSALQHKE
ncbi:MAG: HD domain-containing protein [Bryobacteraceae bacterium]